MSEKRTGLGRGLDALLPGRQPARSPIPGAGGDAPRGGVAQDSGGSASRNAAGNAAPSPQSGERAGLSSAAVDRDALAGARLIAVDAIERNPYQTRGKIDEAALEELAASIREQGVLQPILVREVRGKGASTSNSTMLTDSGGGASRQALDSERQGQSIGASPRGGASSDSGGGAARDVSSHNQNQLQGNAISNRGTSHDSDRSAARNAHTENQRQGIVGSNPTLSPSGDKDGARDVGAAGAASSTLPNASSAIRYQLMAGERRWLAAQRAGLKVIPAVVKQTSDEQAMEITIIENLQREDLNPMEQARAFERLSREFALTQAQIAVKTGKDRASVGNFMRLLKLPAAVQAHIEADTLSMGHGKVLMMLQNEPIEMQERVAARAAESGMSVRELEELVLKLMGPPAGTLKQQADRRDPNVVAAERELQSALGCKVKITDRMGKGKIVLEYASLEDFDRIVEVLGKS